MQGKMIRNLILDRCNTGRHDGTAFSWKDRFLVLALLYYAWHLNSDYICIMFIILWYCSELVPTKEGCNLLF